MTNTSNVSPPHAIDATPPAACLHTLVPTEVVRIDPHPLVAMHHGSDPATIPYFIAKCRNELTILVHRLDTGTAWRRGGPGLLGRIGLVEGEDIFAAPTLLNRISDVALRVGIPELDRAARQAAATWQGGDDTAHAATIARIIRLCHLSVAGLSAMRVPPDPPHPSDPSEPAPGA